MTSGILLVSSRLTNSAKPPKPNPKAKDPATYVTGSSVPRDRIAASVAQPQHRPPSASAAQHGGALRTRGFSVLREPNESKHLSLVVAEKVADQGEDKPKGHDSGSSKTVASASQVLPVVLEDLRRAVRLAIKALESGEPREVAIAILKIALSDK